MVLQCLVEGLQCAWCAIRNCSAPRSSPRSRPSSPSHELIRAVARAGADRVARRACRHDLPWQQDRTPYRVWVSEIMLQQTQVITVIDYYQRFLQRFPDLASLAAAPLDEVCICGRAWLLLTRRNLKRAAERIVAEYGGISHTREALRVAALAAPLPPPSWRCRTASARPFSMQCPARAVAGVRHRRCAAAPETLRALWACAEAATPQTDVATYTQAIMDFGATLCTRHEPLCMPCPLRSDCVALATGRVRELPVRRTRAARRTRS